MTHSKASDVLATIAVGDDTGIYYKSMDKAAHQLYQDILGLIGEDRQYEKYKPCPDCGRAFQYQCSCDTAEANAKQAMRTALETYFGQGEV